MTHYVVASAYARSDDEQTLRRHQSLVRRQVLAMAARTGVDPDDLWSAAALGLLDGVKRFDTARGVPLTAFLCLRIRGAMLDEIRRLDRLPRRLRRRASAVAKARSDLSSELGREPTREEMGEALGVEPGEIDEVTRAAESPLVVDDLELGDPSAGAEALVVDRETRGRLVAAIDALPERLRTVLTLRYVEESTLKEIAEVLGVSEPRVCQLHAQATQKLRAMMQAHDAARANAPRASAAQSNRAKAAAETGDPTQATTATQLPRTTSVAVRRPPRVPNEQRTATSEAVEATRR